jgi:hypothetical protein
MAKTVVKIQTPRLASLLLKARTQSLCYLFPFLWVQICFGQELPSYSLKDVPIVVNIDSVKSVPKEMAIFSNIRYIPLETTDDCLIGDISKTLIRDGRIYVADFHNTFALFVFDMNGKFLFKISNRGQGPHEYISFNDFDIHNNGDIYMFDFFGKKFLVFNSSGEYQSEIRTDYYFSYFCLMKDKMYWARLGENGKKYADLAVYDITDKNTEFLLKDKKLLLTNEQYNYVSYRFFKSTSGATYYSPRFSEIIYRIDDEGVHPAIGIKNLRIPPKHIIEEWESKFDAMSEDELYFKENTLIYETEIYIAFWCNFGFFAFSKYLVYNKKSNSFSSVGYMSFQTILCVNGIRGSTGTDFFSVMNPNPEFENHRRLLESREDLKNWKDDDNPVIVFFNLDI